MKYIKSFENETAKNAYIAGLTADDNGYYVFDDKSKEGFSGMDFRKIEFFDFDGLTMTATGSSTVNFNTQLTDIQYKINDGDWTNYVSDTSLNLSNGDKLYWLRNGDSVFFNSLGQFSMTGSIAASGNCYSLISSGYKTLDDLTSWEYLFSQLFASCTSLTSAPELPATTLGYGCYANMFLGCRSLTSAPELPATTLATYCYDSMFASCTSLTSAPELPATTLANYCYASMFYNCSNLKYVKCYASNISASGCLNNWLANVSSTGDFYKNANTTYPSGSKGIPAGWTKHNI